MNHLSHQNVLAVLLQKEQNIRQLFLHYRKREITYNEAFHLKSLSLRIIPTAIEEVVNLSFSLHIEITNTKGVVHNREEIIQTNTLLRVTHHRDFEIFIHDANLYLSDLGQSVYQNWRSMTKLLLEDIFFYQQEDVHLFYWFYKNQEAYVWVKSYADIEKLIGTNKGSIRKISFNPDTHKQLQQRVKSSTDASEEDLYLAKREGNLLSPVSLQERLHQEKQCASIKNKMLDVIKSS